MRVAVAGGTGLVGQRVVERLRAGGHEPVPLSRGAGVDLIAGTGVDAALAGVDTVVDATSTTSRTPAECVAFFGGVARTLQAAGERAGVRRIVTLSIVGIDGLGGPAFGHYAGKRAQEQATEAGAVPTTILRASQFHGFAGQLIDWTRKGPFVVCPFMPMRPVDVDVVAEHLVRLAVADDAPRRQDLVGPQRIDLIEAVRRTAKLRGDRVLALPVWLPGASARKVRSGVLQGGPDAIVDGPSFDEFAASRH